MPLRDAHGRRVSAKLASRHGKAAALPLAAAVVASLLSVARAGIGFCLDQIPVALKDTGYSAESTLDQAACTSGGHAWCPLVDDKTVWNSPAHGSITFYFFSVCCTGKQGRNLFADSATGLPSCKNGFSSLRCSRNMWHNKFMADYIDYSTSGYRFMVTPSSLKTDPRKYGGADERLPCVCNVTHPGCERVSSDGKNCTVCKTSTPCSEDKVSFGVNFFKIHSVDLKSSALSFAAWLRMEWWDHRLKYDYQCYGGLEYFEVIGEPGNLENSRVWTPDFELINAEENLWRGSYAGRLAYVYACWDGQHGKPTRGGCGYIFQSRPGIMKALCKYNGLVRFPYDSLSCQLEFSAWSVDGRFQDIALRTKGAVEWMSPNSNAITGLTAGSKFQNYKIENITAYRVLVVYEAAPIALWPELLYTVHFSRSAGFYAIQLVLPGCLLTVLSFIAFWMNPEVTDRLGFGVTVMLAMITNQIIASTYMPVCEEKVLMDYLSIAFVVFGALSLFQTGLVLYLYQLKAEDWLEAIVPRWVRSICLRGLCASKKEKKKKKPALNRQSTMPKSLTADKDYQLRRQMYHQIFYAIDVDFSGTLQLDEIDEFGYFIAGAKWNIDEAEHFLMDIDANWDGVLDYEEFAYFCEESLLTEFKLDPDTLKQMIKGFLVVIEKKLEARRLMWKMRATQLDQFCRWAIPPGFIFFLLLCWNISEEDLTSISTNEGWQTIIILSGLFPILMIIAGYALFSGVRAQILHSTSFGGGGMLSSSKLNDSNLQDNEAPQDIALLANSLDLGGAVQPSQLGRGGSAEFDDEEENADDVYTAAVTVYGQQQQNKSSPRNMYEAEQDDQDDSDANEDNLQQRGKKVLRQRNQSAGKKKKKDRQSPSAPASSVRRRA